MPLERAAAAPSRRFFAQGAEVTPSFTSASPSKLTQCTMTVEDIIRIIVIEVPFHIATSGYAGNVYPNGGCQRTRPVLSTISSLPTSTHVSHILLTLWSGDRECRQYLGTLSGFDAPSLSILLISFHRLFILKLSDNKLSLEWLVMLW